MVLRCFRSLILLFHLFLSPSAAVFLIEVLQDLEAP